MNAPESVLIGIKAVRDSKQAVMIDRKEVYLWAMKLGFYEAAQWLSNHKHSYLELLLHTDWNTVPSLFDEDMLV